MRTDLFVGAVFGSSQSRDLSLECEFAVVRRVTGHAVAGGELLDQDINRDAQGGGLKSKGSGYQTRINEILRKATLKDITKA